MKLAGAEVLKLKHALASPQGLIETQIAALASVTRLGIIPQSKRSPVQFPVRAHAWDAGSFPLGARTRCN